MSDGAVAGEVRITPREVYDRVLGMESNVADVKNLLERVVDRQEQRDKTVDTRLEEHSTQLGGIDTRLTSAELDVRLLKEQAATKERRRTPWTALVGAIVGIITGIGGLIAVLVTLNTIAAALSPNIP